MIKHRDPVSVFISYADADEQLLHELGRHLNLLQQQGLISTWHKRQVIPGTNRAEAIDEHLSEASLILLLVSSDFLASDYCYGIEVQRALARQNAREVRVIPILLRPVDWQSTPFGKLQALPSNGKPVTSWPDRDEAFVDIAKGIRAILQDIQPLSIAISSPFLPIVWNIPYPPNPFFTGRSEILKRIESQLQQAGQATALSQPQAISGLGGIGKTQIAIEFAYRHRHEYQFVFWVLADTREALVSGYIAVAGLLNLPEKDAEAQEITIGAVRHWLQTHEVWLLILDNADELTIVREFIPAIFGGHILLTTRAQSMGRLALRIEVETMDHDMGALFLLRRAGKLSENASLDTASPVDQALARSISEELGGLPLALDQAGGYIEETQCNLQGYQMYYRTRRAQLLKRRGGLVADHPESVATTWSLSLEKVEQKNPAAAELLRFCAFLHPDAIPEEILTSGAKHLGPVLQPVASDSLLLNNAIAVLWSYSLISRDPKERTLTIHRLVQAVLKDAMNMATQWDWMQRVILAVSEAFPREVGVFEWPQCERCLPHALICADFIEQGGLMLLEAASLLNATGKYLMGRGRYREAEPLFARACTIREWLLGSEDPDTAKVLRNQSILYRILGKYKEAEQSCQRALTVFERQLGVSSTDTAMSLAILGDLADLYKTQGKYLEAELLYQRALEIRERKLGTDHPDIAASLNDLAILYRTQGRNLEAELLYQRALEIRERQFGEMHPSTALSLNNLAVLYRQQGKYAKAELLYVRALEIYEKQLGEIHPSTARSLNNLAQLYLDERRYSEAERLFSRSLIICEQVLGEEHLTTLQSMACLGSLYLRQHLYEKAELLYKRVLSSFQQTFGLRHQYTQAAMKQYILILRALDRNEEADSLEGQGHSP